MDAVIKTYTKEDFSLINVDTSKIHLEDIAHSLSLTCRFAGQVDRFYSVAEHSINCLIISEYFNYSNKEQLYTLLHDASEAYICDIPSPLKKLLPDYKKYEKNLQNKIFDAFNLERLSDDEYKKIKKIDEICFHKEWSYFMDPNYHTELSDIFVPNLSFQARNMKDVESDFNEKAKELIKKVRV